MQEVGEFLVIDHAVDCRVNHIAGATFNFTKVIVVIKTLASAVNVSEMSLFSIVIGQVIDLGPAEAVEAVIPDLIDLALEVALAWLEGTWDTVIACSSLLTEVKVDDVWIVDARTQVLIKDVQFLSWCENLPEVLVIAERL